MRGETVSETEPMVPKSYESLKLAVAVMYVGVITCDIVRRQLPGENEWLLRMALSVGDYGRRLAIPHVVRLNVCMWQWYDSHAAAVPLV